MTRLKHIALSPLLALSLATPAVVFGVLTPVQASAGTSAMETFKAQHEAVVKLVKKKASSKTLEKQVDQLLDYRWVAFAALGGEESYGDTCAERCDEFETLLGDLIRRNYLRMVRQASTHDVVYLGEKTGKTGAVKIDTEITVKKNDRDQVVKVSYVMHEVEGSWQVRDIITDGVSLAKTYRYEFKQLLADGGIDSVISKLKKKVDQLDAD